MTIATWNVNGIRARQDQVLAWLEREHPDVVCLQEIKATPDQVPVALWEMQGYWCYFHGGKGYSGVALLVARGRCAQRPMVWHPPFDLEHRIAVTTVGEVDVASVYVPNGGKDFAAKMAFLRDLEAFADHSAREGRLLAICGDLNVAIHERDVHPKERKPAAIGQRPEERAAFSQLLSRGLVDTTRALHPEADDLFTWWPPWRQMRERNIGWRIDYILASSALAERANESVIQRLVGTSDHAPVLTRFVD